VKGMASRRPVRSRYSGRGVFGLVAPATSQIGEAPGLRCGWVHGLEWHPAKFRRSLQ
jgi:hypothetical protein